MCSQFYLYLKGSCIEGSKSKLYKSNIFLKTAFFYLLHQKFVLLKMDYFLNMWKYTVRKIRENWTLLCARSVDEITTTNNFLPCPK